VTDLWDQYDVTQCGVIEVTDYGQLFTPDYIFINFDLITLMERLHG